MIAVSGLKLRPGEPEQRLPGLAAKALRVPERAILDWKITKKSLDARKKSDIHYIYTVAVTLSGDENAAAARCKSARIYAPFSYDIPVAALDHRPVVIGFGPGGMFAALVLSMTGARPIVLERGRTWKPGKRPWTTSAGADPWTRKPTCSSARAVRGRSPMAS